MPRERNKNLLMYLRQVVSNWRDDSREDAELLSRFADDHDELAFRVLVGRYGPLVWNTCRRTLGDTPDAEDAFQAVFMSVVKKAELLRREPLAGWLHQAARWVVQKTVVSARRRKGMEQRMKAQKCKEAAESNSRAELYTELDKELVGLPERFRVPLLLHYLEGKSQLEVARILGCSRTSVQKRLAKGEALLRKRLERSGLTLGAVTVASLLSEMRGAGTTPSGLIDSTVSLAMDFRNGMVTGPVAESVQLALRSMRSSSSSRVWLLAIACVSSIGIGLLAWRVPAGPADGNEFPATDVPAAIAKPKVVRVDLHGNSLPQHALARLGEESRHGINPFAVFTPDGKQLLILDGDAGPMDNALHLWDVAAGKVVRSFGRGLNRPVRAVMAPDGRNLLVTCRVTDSHSYVCLWDMLGDRELCSWARPKGYSSGFPASVFPGIFTPDGSAVFVTAFSENEVPKTNQLSILLCNANSGKVIRHFAEISLFPLSMAIDSDGKTLVALTNDIKVLRWEIVTGKQTLKLSVTKGSGPDALLSVDGRTMVAVDKDSYVCVWDTTRGKCVKQWPYDVAKRGGFSNWMLSPDCKSLVVCDGFQLNAGDAYLPPRVLELATGKLLYKLENEGQAQAVMRDPITKGRFELSPDGKLFAGVCWSTVTLWDVSTGRVLGMTSVHRNCLTKTIVLDRNAILTRASYFHNQVSDNTIRLWDRSTGRLLDCLEMSSDSCLLPCIVSSPDGRTVVIGEVETSGNAPTSHLRLWDRQLRREVRFASFPGILEAVVISSDGRRLITKANEIIAGLVNIRLWDAASGEELRCYRTEQQRDLLGLVQGGQLLLTGIQTTRGYELQWLSIDEGRVAYVLPLKQSMNVRAISRDGMLAANIDERKDEGLSFAHVLDVTAGGKELCTLPVVNFSGVMGFTEDGTVLATGHDNGTVRLWDTATGEHLAYLQGGHHYCITTLAFSPDGQILVSGGRDGSALVWDVGKLLYPVVCSVPPKSSELENWWAELASRETGRRHSAIKAMRAAPEQSVALLRTRLHPPSSPPDLVRIGQLLEELSADAFEVRERAVAKLKSLGEYARPAIHQALAKKPEIEVRRRLEILLDPLPPDYFRNEWIRNLHGLRILEGIGTQKACRVLKQVGTVFPDSSLRSEAEECLKRLASHKGVRP